MHEYRAHTHKSLPAHDMGADGLVYDTPPRVVGCGGMDSRSGGLEYTHHTAQPSKGQAMPESRYIRINNRLEISHTGDRGWRIYVDGDEVQSEGEYDHKEDAAMAGQIYLMSVA